MITYRKKHPSIIFEKLGTFCWPISFNIRYSHLFYDNFFLHPYIFLPAPPKGYAKTKLSPLYFKNPKMHLNCIYFFAFWIMESGKILD